MYNQDYFVAFDTDDSIICHSADEQACVNRASEVTDYLNIQRATRMTDAQFADALNQVSENDWELMSIVGGYFCGKLIYHCNGYFFDNYGERIKRSSHIELRFKLPSNT